MAAESAVETAASDALARWSRKQARETAAFAALSDLLTGEAALDGVVLAECLRIAEDRTVFLAHLDGAPLVIKHFTGADGIARAAQVHQELTSRYAIMGSGLLQVCEPKLFLPQKPLTFRAYQAGERLDTILQNAIPAARAQKLRQAGQWLDLYTSDSRKTAGFGPWKWIKRIAPQRGTPFAPLLNRLKARLREQAPHLMGKPVQVARTHGDFAALNLICDGPVMTGIDIENRHELAVTKDLARFLAQAQSYRRPQGGWLPNPDLDAILEGFGPLPEFDRGPVLRFFYGVELGRRLMGSQGTEAETENLASALRSYVNFQTDSR
ncbi:hypothetical protein [Neptunicoccus sediminis]|uniref:hypothetical protein n=1 Tax=Neptunicoccus sediminis TaxID=1892596 RepID=UPI000845CB32|nr:hypothetical protein [Neptunicoccus sediminis]